MALPTPEELEAELAAYVDAPTDMAEYVATCVERAIAFVERQAPNVGPGDVLLIDGEYETIPEDGPVISPLGDVLYQQEVIELGSELYYRRQARNGVVTVGVDGNPIRISADPFRASTDRIARLRPGGFA